MLGQTVGTTILARRVRSDRNPSSTESSNSLAAAKSESFLLAIAEPVEHHRRRKEHGGRVGLVLSRDVGRAAVRRLEQGMVKPDFGTRRHAHSTDQSAAQIGKDIGEHVFHDQNVEIPRATDQVQRLRVHVIVAGLNIRVQERPFAKIFLKKAYARKTLDLSTQVTAPLAAPDFRRRARLKAKSNSFSEVARVI